MIELSWKQIRPTKVRFVITIASFNSNANDPSMQFMSKVKRLKDQSDL